MSRRLALVSVLLISVAVAQNKPHKAPTLGFTHIKDVSPILDSDALSNENRLQEKLPGNPLVGDERAVHEMGLMQEFIDGFRNVKACNGITFYKTEQKSPDFDVQITVNFHDTPDHEQEWIWMLGQGKSLAGVGKGSTGKLTARDVCLTVWDDVDPNHFKRPGGKVE